MTDKQMKPEKEAQIKEKNKVQINLVTGLLAEYEHEIDGLVLGERPWFRRRFAIRMLMELLSV